MCRFWEAVQELKALPLSDVQEKVEEIWGEFLAPDASCPINVDSRSYEMTKKNMENPDCWSFDATAVRSPISHILLFHCILFLFISTGPRVPFNEK